MLQKNWTELIKPKGLKIDPGEHPAREATIVVQPLERGFGLTLGNALRRILLSSLQGAAVTSIQIDGVLHEFSSMPGVNEDTSTSMDESASVEASGRIWSMNGQANAPAPTMPAMPVAI